MHRSPTSTNPDRHASHDPGPTLSQAAHPSPHGWHLTPPLACTLVYPLMHSSHEVVEPHVQRKQFCTRQAGRVLRLARRKLLLLREEPPEDLLRAPWPSTSPKSDAHSNHTTEQSIAAVRRRPRRSIKLARLCRLISDEESRRSLKINLWHQRSNKFIWAELCWVVPGEVDRRHAVGFGGR